MAKNITFNLSTSNLGPHENLKINSKLSSLDFGIYANNGTGKTFLSRAFRLISNNNLTSEDSNKLITLGKDNGSFKLNITNTEEPGVIRELDISLKKDTPPKINNNTSNYIFRVFNDDYIKDNLEVSKFKPNGEIEGYILGKEKIDLSKEKKELENFKNSYSKLEKIVDSNLENGLTDLDNLSIRKNTTEYQNIKLHNLLNEKYNVKENENFNTLKNNHNQLKLLPDNLPDLRKIETITFPNIFDVICKFLNQNFTKSKIAEDFKSKVKIKQDFVEQGVEYLKTSNENCPFCEQKLENKSLELIDKYLEYFSENEAIQIKKANDLISQLLGSKKTFNKFYKSHLYLQKEYLKNQKFIPSMINKDLNEITDSDNLNRYFDIIQKALEKKKENIEANVKSNDIDKSIKQIKNWFINSNSATKSNFKIIDDYNNKKNNSNTEKLGLNRRLCNAKFIEIREIEENNIKQLKLLKSQIKNKTDEILIKEQKDKISKKNKIIETFKSLLTKFFGEKYTLDEKTFSLKFKTHILKSNASDVLSNGEKSIVAFCYYIAETHKFIENENDYKKLFFIIDDPISSQDFHFVYATTQIIRTLNKQFSIPRLRVLIFTHNLEFMSIIIRNKIIKQKFILINNKLESLRDELIMPYEHHLRDIYNVSNNNNSPSHTTANSIRHILETINKFVAPDTALNCFCERIEGYSENEFLFSLMHDGSHGTIRLEKAYTDEMIKSACTVVTGYIRKHYSGQIKILK